MTTRIRFDELVLQTATNRHRYRFDQQITTIVGPIGTGKTSLLELLKYALGGSGTLSQAVDTAVQRVEVRATVGVNVFVFARRIGAVNVDVHDADGLLLETVSTRNSRSLRSASDFLLEAAGLPAMTLTRSRTASRGRVEKISFFDVYRYAYVSQSEVDRSVVRHIDPILERRRKATFEMLLGLTDTETAAADAKVAEVEVKLAAARQDEASVRRFLEEAGEAPEVELLGELDRVDASVASARAELDGLRADLRAATSDEAGRQRQVASFAERARSLNERASILAGQIQQRAETIAQFELSLERLTRTNRARAILDQIEFSRCPRCMQALAGRVVDDGHCVLCLQVEPPRRQIDFSADAPSDGQLTFTDPPVNEERRRLEAQRDELIEVAADERAELDQVLAEQRALDVTMREVLADLDRRTEQYVSPRFEAISELSAGVAAAESRAETLRRILAFWNRFRELSGRVTTLMGELADARARAEESKLALEARRAIVGEISEAFDEIIRRVQPPWYSSDETYVSSTTYLPVNHGAAFESLSGGEKTVVNVAYHLALLTVALARRDTDFPALLVIDTPRKNLGSGQDQALASAMYRQISALSDAHPGAFQMLIADNDDPPIQLPRSATIKFDYSSPLIPDLQHPGPDEVEPIRATSD